MRKKISVYPTTKSEIKITPLRRAILLILAAAKNPLSAYTILEKLQKIRQGAKPATVYRVLDFLIEAKMVHRIESQKTYVSCSQKVYDGAPHETVLLFCKKCEKSFECEGKEVLHTIQLFTEHNKFIVDNAPIEIKGICQRCSFKN